MFLIAAELPLLLGAAVWGAAAASADFDLGEDLELGRAVHGGAGPWVAASAALLLVAIGVLGIWWPKVCGLVLLGSAVAAVVLTAALAITSTVLDSDTIDVSLEAIPFVVAFYAVPSVIPSVFLIAAGSGPT